MDEFVMYKRLACLETSQQANIYRESCFAYPIQFLNFDFYRSYEYTGVTSSILAAPFFLLIKQIWINYLIGAFFLFVIGVGIIKSFEFPKKTMFYLFIFFPISFTVLHDGGPVRLSLVAMSWTPYLVRNFVEVIGHKKYFWLSSAALLWIFSTEDKPYFLFLIPGIFLLTIWALISTREVEYVKTNLRKIILTFALLSLISFSVLFMLQVDNAPYLSYLINRSPSPNTELLKNSLASENLEIAIQNVLIRKLIFSFVWAYFPHRVLNMTDFQFGSFLLPFPGLSNLSLALASTFYILSTLCVVVIYFQIAKRIFRKKNKTEIPKNLLYVLTIFTFWISSTLAGGWTSHHYVFMQVAILVLILEALLNTKSSVMKVLLVIGSLSSLISVSLIPANTIASPEIETVYEAAIANSDGSTIISCSSWGCYYQFALMNKNEIPIVFVTSSEDFEKMEIQNVQQGKNIFVMCSDCSINSVQSLLSNSTVSQVKTDTEIWKLFLVTKS